MVDKKIIALAAIIGAMSLINNNKKNSSRLVSLEGIKEFEQKVIQSSVPVLVLFSVSRCPACRAVSEPWRLCQNRP